MQFDFIAMQKLYLSLARQEAAPLAEALLERPARLQPAVLAARDAGAVLRRGDRHGREPGRLAVRTPMQWTDGKNGGFSNAPPSRLPGPVTEGGFGPEHVNVQRQRRDPDSLLSFMTMLIRFEVLDQPHPSVLAHRCTWHDGSLVAVHNLSPEYRTVPLRLKDCDDAVRLADQLCDGVTPVSANGSCEIELGGYGYRWLRIVGEGDRTLN
jgi:hypothetical protein